MGLGFTLKNKNRKSSQDSPILVLILWGSIVGGCGELCPFVWMGFFLTLQSPPRIPFLKSYSCFYAAPICKYNLLSFKAPRSLSRISGRANQWDGPTFPAIPLGSDPEADQGRHVCHSDVTQVNGGSRETIK